MIRNLPIRTKLIAILITPLVALTVLASLGIGANVASGGAAEHVSAEAAFAGTLSGLIHQLQQERDLSAGWVAGGRKAGHEDVARQRPATNQAVAAFRRGAQDLGQHASPFYQQVQTALTGLGKLNDQRRRTNADAGLTADGTLGLYSPIIGDLLAADLAIAGETDNRTLIRNVATFAALARLKEAASQERGFVNAITAAGRFGPGEYQQLAAIAGNQDSWHSQFDATATPEQRAALNQALSSRDARQAGELRRQLLAGDLTGPVGVGPRQWFGLMTGKLQLLRAVEREVAGQLATAADAARAIASRQALIYTIILTVILWFTVGLSVLMARSMVGPLQTLTRTANDVAEERLPGLVERLHHSRDPRDLDTAIAAVPVTSTDEIGQVSAAFNSVHQVALQVATEQAALRKSIGDMFLNLARRSQSLIDRQLELIDDLERTEADPDVLDSLFRLDHLATRMRRNAENLIVLSGAEPARRWRKAVPLVDVVRAALAEVEDYKRIELLDIDDVGVAGQTVSDVVHLLAELIENATSFSPPNTKVRVAGQGVSIGYVLEIEDRGLGMSDEELAQSNERLANPPMIDFSLSRMLGLYVVGQLGQRYGIKVQLRHSWYGGITALVLLPPSVTTAAPDVEGPIAAPPTGWPQLNAFGPLDVSPPLASVGGDRDSGPPAGGEPGAGIHLPFFEAAHSDWFESSSDPPPLRRSSQPPPTVVAPAAAPDLPVELPASPPLRSAFTAPQAAGAMPAADAADTADLTEPAPMAAPPVAPEQLTGAGLPRRVPQTHLAPGMVAAAGPSTGPPPSAAADGTSSPLPRFTGPRSPEEVRSLLSSYRSGLERGRMVAAGEPPGTDGDVFLGSDHDGFE
jgi:hypothetical protein